MPPYILAFAKDFQGMGYFARKYAMMLQKQTTKFQQYFLFDMNLGFFNQTFLSFLSFIPICFSRTSSISFAVFQYSFKTRFACNDLLIFRLKTSENQHKVCFTYQNKHDFPSSVYALPFAYASNIQIHLEEVAKRSTAMQIYIRKSLRHVTHIFNLYFNVFFFCDLCECFHNFAFYSFTKSSEIRC